MRSENFVTKRDVAVRITLASGRQMEGTVFTLQQERLSDMMNNGQDFVPVVLADESFHLLRKSAVEEIVPIEQRDH